MPVSNVFLYRMPAGIPGAVNREQEHTGEPNQMDLTNPPTAYGDPVKMGSNGKIQALAPGDTLASVYGFLERPYPGSQSALPVANIAGGSNVGFGNITPPPPGGRCTIMKRGYMSVQMQGATAASPGSQVFIRINGTVPSGGRLNGLEAASDATPANSIALPIATSYYRGAADANGNTEIAFNI